jgi:lipopolysaccharide assembly outer membrane protein LptD (OstA)
MKYLNRTLNAGLLVCLLPLALHFKANSKTTFTKLLSTDTIPLSLVKDNVKFSAADSIVTNEDKYIVKLYGKACITNSEIRVNADYIEYNKSEKTGTAKGNVILYEISKNVMAKSSEATFKLK